MATFPRTRTARRAWLLLFFLPALLLAALCRGAPALAEPVRVLCLDMEAALTPVQADILDEALQRVVRERFDLLLVRLDTPGGGAEAMRRMVKLILAAPRPVAIWVGPAGARAGGAGMLLLAAAAQAGMAPGCELVSAEAVGLAGQDAPPAMVERLRSDAEALLRAVAVSRGRSVEVHLRALEAGVSLTAEEAHRERVVDFLADGLDAALERIGSAGLVSGDRALSFGPGDVQLATFSPGLRHALLSWLLMPRVAYLLLLGGMAGLFFELMRPGALIPGFLGATSLLLGLYAVTVLPTNVVGLLFLLLGQVLFVLEVHVGSYGLLTFAGGMALFTGSQTLFRTPEGMGLLPMSTIAATVFGLTALLVLAMIADARARLRQELAGLADLEGALGMVRNWRGASGQVFVRGGLRKARSRGDVDLAPGAQVRIVKADGAALLVEPVRRKPPRQ